MDLPRLVCPITSTHRHRNTVSVETTQSVHDTLRKPRGRPVVFEAAIPLRSAPASGVANPSAPTAAVPAKRYAHAASPPPLLRP